MPQLLVDVSLLKTRFERIDGPVCTENKILQ
jgi:hypothetical protein